MSIRWVRHSSLVFESRDQAFSEVETLSKEHTYRVMQIDGYPPAYVIERKLPDREQKYTDDETDSLLHAEDRVYEEKTEEESFLNKGRRRGREAHRDRDEGTDDVPSDEELFGDDYGSKWE